MAKQLVIISVCLTILLALVAAMDTQNGFCDSYTRPERSVTASGEPFNSSALTAAHKTLPFGTEVRLIYGFYQLKVRINDRPTGDVTPNKILYITAKAAKDINMWPNDNTLPCTLVTNE